MVLASSGRYLAGVGRTGLHHCLDQHVDGVVDARAQICTSVLNLFLNLARKASIGRSWPRLRHRRLPADDPTVGDRVTRQLRATPGADAVAAQELGLMPSCFIWRSIGPATASMPPKKTVGLLSLKAVRMEVKSVALSLVNSRPTILPPAPATPFLELVGYALTVGRAVVDDGDGLAFEFIDRIAAQGAAEVHVVGHHAERGLEA